MASAKGNPLGRRGFLKGAAVSAAALVAKGAPVAAAEPQQPGSSRATPSTPSTTQLTADTEPPRRAAAARVIERPGSDFMVDVIKTLNFEYVAANPGSSFEGLHESIINYGGNKNAGVPHVLPRGIAVAMAHGYAKIEGKPMMALAPRQHRHAARGDGRSTTPTAIACRSS